MPPIKHDLTDNQLNILLQLVRAEAKRLGYGTQWHDEPGKVSGWPVRLGELRTIARKLWVYREALHTNPTLGVKVLDREE